MLLLMAVTCCYVCAIQHLLLLVVVVVVVFILEPQGLQVISFIQSLPYCGCSCSHLPCIGSREAARECRRKKKEYVKCLENRVAVLENQNKTLIEELKALKDLYCHKAE
uniref:cAMP responsive element modulator n=1 Tax=Gallus gallus TaxID=9031 RepID=A0A8V0XH53_CHICK